jgi:hypothetical protein
VFTGRPPNGVRSPGTAVHLEQFKLHSAAVI